MGPIILAYEKCSSHNGKELFTVLFFCIKINNNKPYKAYVSYPSTDEYICVFP